MFRALGLSLTLATALLWSVLSPIVHAVPAPALAARRAKQARRARPSAAELRAQRLGLGTIKTAGALLAGRPMPSWIHAAGATALPGTLRFPVARGWFVRGFGSGKGGYHQAMDIGGQLGWNVRAAAPGIVGYASNEVSGYGNLILIVHPGGWVTAYGHNAKNLVVAGQQVDRGTVIAELGSTGRSKGPHVHFELLYRGQNCDPGPLFRPSARLRDGKLAHLARTAWKEPERRPKAIACHPRKHHPDYVAKQEEEEPDDGSAAENAPEDAPAGE